VRIKKAPHQNHFLIDLLHFSAILQLFSDSGHWIYTEMTPITRPKSASSNPPFSQPVPG